MAAGIALLAALAWFVEADQSRWLAERPTRTEGTAPSNVLSGLRPEPSKRVQQGIQGQGRRGGFGSRCLWWLDTDLAGFLEQHEANRAESAFFDKGPVREGAAVEYIRTGPQDCVSQRTCLVPSRHGEASDRPAESHGSTGGGACGSFAGLPDRRKGRGYRRGPLCGPDGGTLACGARCVRSAIHSPARNCGHWWVWCPEPAETHHSWYLDCCTTGFGTSGCWPSNGVLWTGQRIVSSWTARMRQRVNSTPTWVLETTWLRFHGTHTYSVPARLLVLVWPPRRSRLKECTTKQPMARDCQSRQSRLWPPPPWAVSLLETSWRPRGMLWLPLGYRHLETQLQWSPPPLGSRRRRLLLVGLSFQTRRSRPGSTILLPLLGHIWSTTTTILLRQMERDGDGRA